jgi:L-methionine (R)-S-oxide reductase
MGSGTKRIHVRLLNEGTDVSRPVEAIEMGEGLFKILATTGYDPEDEEWEFPPGTIVRLKERHDNSGEYFIAIPGNREPNVQLANIQQLKTGLQAFAKNATSADELMSEIVDFLHKNMPAYNWAGFYMLEKSLAAAQPPMLVLGPFRGAPTPHTRIPLNQGICGAAASTGETVIVDDVNADPRYLSCSLETKSEIVAPVFVHGEVAGELDIDSHTRAAFTAEDRELVEYCASLVGRFLEASPR